MTIPPPQLQPDQNTSIRNHCFMLSHVAKGYVQDERYFAIEHMDVRREASQAGTVINVRCEASQAGTTIDYETRSVPSNKRLCESGTSRSSATAPASPEGAYSRLRAPTSGGALPPASLQSCASLRPRHTVHPEHKRVLKKGTTHPWRLYR